MSSSMVLAPASTTELVRSNQKDRYYSGYLGTLMADIIEPYIPQRYWWAWQRELALIGELMYYWLTTVRGNQTLGEEYTNTVQVINSVSTRGYAVPGTLRRTLAIFLQVFGRYLIEKFLYMISDAVTHRKLPVTLNTKLYKLLSTVATNAADIVASVNQLHLSLFYLGGMYHSLGKRITGIHYLMVQYERLSTPTNPYRLLGILLLLQVVYRLVKTLLEGCGLVASSEEPINDTSPHEYVRPMVGRNEVVSRSLKCALCLEACRVPTATPCGHVMCWKCSAEWIREKQECPICRNELEPRQLTPLQHFEMR